VALVRTDVSEELIASIIRVTVFIRSVLQLLVTANVAPSSQILTTLMDAISSSGTSVLIRATRSNTPENGILFYFSFSFPSPKIPQALSLLRLYRPLPDPLGGVSSYHKTSTALIPMVKPVSELAILVKNGVFWDVTRCGSHTRPNIPKDAILHSHRRENLKSYIAILVLQ
jgi:hypothetical protein